MRKFYFLNSSGERWPLQGEKGVYLTDPTGLGVTLAQTYADLQNGFFVGVSSANEPQSAPHATLLFVRPAYAAYRQLINWLAAAGDLELVYCPYGTEEFHRRVDVQAISKGELDEHAFLACELSLLARSPWFKAAATRLDLASQSADESLRYDIVYTDDLIYGEDATASLSGTLHPDGHVPAAISVTFYGARPRRSSRSPGSSPASSTAPAEFPTPSPPVRRCSSPRTISIATSGSSPRRARRRTCSPRSISTASRSSVCRSPSPARSPSRRRRRSPARRT